VRYPEPLIIPMREDLTRHGIQETRTPEEVDAALQPGSGTVLVVINSVCGCAAGKARPGVVMSLNGEPRPDKAITVFAGADIEAVAHVRNLLSEYPPSSPSVALFKDGKPVYMLHRFQIEGSTASDIAATLRSAYAQYCGQTQPAS
jgi:putative YphP/YqiW family bacilliredoxin